MITINNLEKVLDILRFEVSDNKTGGKVYTKTFAQAGDIVVDFHNQSITYPEKINTGLNTTTNFSQNENFVVLECVNRLLEKGYKPEHIFLEKVWTLGHTGKSGRADITVMDNDGKEYLIIECKRSGKDYKDARKELFDDPEGKQLFSYWAQARAVRWLQLYASDYDEESNTIVIQEEIIRSYDDENVILLSKEDDSVQLFSDASTAQDAFMVWDETYFKKTYQNIIFGADSVAYKIGNAPIKNKDLKKFNKQDGIIDSFREILRHNDISDKGNAFNKILSLFICKFVDEDTHKKPSDIMDFQYIDGKDNYYSLYERLFALFKDGMFKYLKNDIWYLGNDYISKTLKQYTGKSRKALEKELTDTFQKTKMLSSQVFAFVEIYNEKDFLQNGKILVEIVELFQNYKLAYTSKDQFLGELFENLLDQGFKQEAGQFFTPIPITRFVWNSLPLDRFLQKDNISIPKVVDFACGSGHFLTEGIAAISDFLEHKIDDNEISKSFYGIDNDKRLARVSKVAMLLNGAGSTNILPGDGLELNEDFLGENNSFDILVANPPYSVDGFKAHRSRRVQKLYETIKLMSYKCKDIQNVFIERMHHLLKPNGLAAIVMPVSLLYATDAADIKTREILLQNFYIHSIVKFGGKTFGKTPTETVILFLEHFDFPPNKATLLSDSVNAILSGENLKDWNDWDVFNEYLKKIEVSESDYTKFSKEEYSLFDNSFCPYFKEYEKNFRTANNDALQKISDTIAKEESGIELKKNEKKSIELKEKLNNEFYATIKQVEREKILHFALTYKQKTLIISAPDDNNEQKKFLGYANSERRHNEGLTETEGLLTDKSNRNAENKLAFFVRSQFNGIQCTINELDKYVKYVSTVDMLDFFKTDFDLKIKFPSEKKKEIKSKFPLIKLDAIMVEVNNAQTKIAKEQIKESGSIPVITQENGTLISGYTDDVTPITDLPLIVFGDHSCTFKYVDFKFVRGADGTQLIKVNKSNNLKYIYYYFQTIELENSGNYERHFKYLKDTMLPHPPLDIQAQIVSECEKEDAEYNVSKNKIEDIKTKISETINNVSGEGKMLKDIAPYTTARIAFAEINAENYISTDNLLQNCEGMKPYGSIPNIYSVISYKEGDILVSNIRPYLKKIWYADRKGGCNPDVLVFRPIEGINSRFVYYSMKQDNFFDYMMQGSKGMKMPRGDKNNIPNYEIPVPSLLEQKRIVSEIESYESEIAKAKAVMDGCAERKKKILEKYLN